MGSRIDLIRNLKVAGMSFAAIGKRLGISRQRVQQLLRAGEDWQELIRNANGRCRECGKPSKVLHAHHDSYLNPASRVLCISCHRLAHSGDPHLPRRGGIVIMRALQSCIDHLGIPPTLDELTVASGFKSKAGVYRHLCLLQQHGFVEGVFRKRRAKRLTEKGMAAIDAFPIDL